MSNTMTEAEIELLEEFEKMLSELKDDDFGFFEPDNSYPNFPNFDDFDEPPPVPKEALEKGKCKHTEIKKVYISNNRAFLVCKSCEANLGEAK